MDAKDKVECYMTFYKRFLESYDKRRSYEWKINFALWTAIALFTGFLVKNEIPVERLPGQWWMLLIYAVLLFAYSFFWIPGLHSSNKLDQEWAHKYREAIQEFITGSNSELRDVKKPDRSYVEPMLRWSPVCQILFTFCILAISWLLLYRPL